MRWNHYGKLELPANHLNINAFAKVVPPNRFKMLQVAMGQLPNTPLAIKNARQYFDGVFGVYADLIGAEKSQVIQAVLLTKAGERAHDILTQEVWAMLERTRVTTKDTDYYRVKSPLSIWRNKQPSKVHIEDVGPAIMEQWNRVVTIQTNQEFQIAASSTKKADTEQKAEDAKKTSAKNYNTSRKNSMKGVQVVKGDTKQKAAQNAAG